jgi:hypothetical protein
LLRSISLLGPLGILHYPHETFLVPGVTQLDLKSGSVLSGRDAIVYHELEIPHPTVVK